MMTWLEFKQAVQAAGATDDMTLDCIGVTWAADIHSITIHIANDMDGQPERLSILDNGLDDYLSLKVYGNA